jgi:hypothetical protein
MEVLVMTIKIGYTQLINKEVMEDCLILESAHGQKLLNPAMMS